MKIKLVFPPAWDIKSPYPSLPCLDGFLKKQGYDCEQFDLNLEVFDYILSSEYLLNCLIEATESDSPENRLALLKFLSANADSCKDILRSEKALEPDVYKSCMAFVNACIFIVSKIWKDERLTPGSYKLRGYNSNNSKDVLNAYKDITSGKIRSHLAEIIKNFVPKISENTDIVGISMCHTEQIIPSLLLSYYLKEHNSDIKIVVGGSLVTRWALTPHILEGFFDVIDYFSFYEGELSLSGLMEHLEGKRDIADVHGLGYINEGKICINPAAPALSMDELPTPVYSKNYLPRYFSPKPVLTLFTCRGCYWNKCAFCDHAYVYRDCFRTRSTELILEDIESCIKEYGTNFFAFNDEAITAPTLRKLSNGIIERGLDIRFRNDARFDKAMDKETLSLAHKAGLRILFYGLESYNERVLTLINKGIKLEWVEPIIKASHEAGIWNHIYVIAGFPTETYKELEDTINFVKSNYQLIDSVCLTPFDCSKYSVVARNPEKYGLKAEENTSKDLSSSITVSADQDNTDLTFHDRFTLCRNLRGAGDEFMDIFSHTASVIFSDCIINYSRRKKRGEISMDNFVVPLYCADNNPSYAQIIDKNRQIRYTKLNPDILPVANAVNKFVFKEDVVKAVSASTGYPEEIAEIMVTQIKESLTQ